MRVLGLPLYLAGTVLAACPYMDGGNSPVTYEQPSPHGALKRDVSQANEGSDAFLDQFTLDDTESFLTTDVGGPIDDQNSLKAGDRGPTLLEDFIFRQKIQHFDHERVRTTS